MEKVAEGEMQPETSKSLCNLSKEAEKLLRAERDRVRLMMELDEHERNYGKRPQLRELASIGFADTTKDPQTNSPKYDNGKYDF
jgi:hypothetical protein